MQSVPYRVATDTRSLLRISVAAVKVQAAMRSCIRMLLKFLREILLQRPAGAMVNCCVSSLHNLLESCATCGYGGGSATCTCYRQRWCSCASDNFVHMCMLESLDTSNIATSTVARSVCNKVSLPDGPCGQDQSVDLGRLCSRKSAGGLQGSQRPVLRAESAG